MEEKFDLSHPSGIIGIWFLGSAFACFASFLVNTILGSGAWDPGTAVAFFTVALVFVIIGSVFMLLGFLCLVLNMKRTKEGSGDKGNANKVVILLIGITIISIAAMGIVAAFFPAT